MYGLLAGTLFVEVFYDPKVRLLPSIGYSIGYFTRPVGAIVFGHLGDTGGRVKTVQAALLTLGLASSLMGALPPHKVVGWASWWALLALHALQGLGIGGIWGGFLLLCYEYCHNDRHKGLFSALPQAGRGVGYMLSAALTSSLHTPTPPAEGSPPPEAGAPPSVVWDHGGRWRLAHLLGLALPLVALYVRTHVPETPEWAAAKRENRLTRVPLFKVRKWVGGGLHVC